MQVVQMIDQLSVGGAQKLLVTFAEQARHSSEIQARLLSLGADGERPLAKEIAALGMPVVTLGGKRLLDMGRLRRMVAYLRSQPVDIVHTHLTYANILGVIAGRLAGVPVVSTLHTAGRDARHYHPLRSWLEILALRWGTAQVLAVGQNVAAFHQPRLGSRRQIEVLPNGVAAAISLSAQERCALRQQVCGDPERPLVLAVGRLSAPKGYADLIEAFSSLKAAHPRAALAIAGDGALCSELSAQIERLGLAGTAFLLGQRQDVPQLLAASDIFASSSHWEGLPLAVLEAMMAGLPVVATRVGDVPQVLVNGSGLLVEPHQPQELAQALKRLLDNPQERFELGARAAEVARSSYSASAWFERLVGVYRKIKMKAEE